MGVQKVHISSKIFLCEYTCTILNYCLVLHLHLTTAHVPHSPNTTGVFLPFPPSSSPTAKEKQSGREERVTEQKKGIEEKGRRVIISDEELECELRQAGEALTVVDFTTER